MHFSSRSLVVATLLFPLRAAVAQPCPASCTQRRSDTPVCSTEAVRDNYDLQHGSFVTGAYNLDYNSVDLNDDFRIEGPPSAVPLSLQVRLEVTGYLHGFDFEFHPYAAAHVRMTAGTDVASQDWLTTDYRDLNENVDLPLARLVGVPFRVEIWAQGESGFGEALVQGHYFFLGLPAGYTLSSCQGFLPDLVGVASSAWGSVKQLYR